MAQKPLRPCNHAGCRELTRQGWCEKHKPKHKRGESAAWHWMYSLPIWEILRSDQLIREPFCRECAARGETVRATVVDHVTPHRGNMRLFRDPGNLQSLCKRCHDRKTLAEQRQRRG